MNRAMVEVFVGDQVKAANDQVQALRDARDRTATDERLSQLWELRRAGYSLRAAIEEVERRSAKASTG
jgi:hypothetical protein